MKALGYVTAFSAWMAASFIWKGYVLSVLWTWFLVGPFGWPSLSIPHATGIALIVGFLTHQDTAAKDERDKWEKITAAIVLTLVAPALALFSGWIVKAFMP